MLSFLKTSIWHYPLDEELKLKIHKTFRRFLARRLMYFQFTSCVYGAVGVIMMFFSLFILIFFTSLIVFLMLKLNSYFPAVKVNIALKGNGSLFLYVSSSLLRKNTMRDAVIMMPLIFGKKNSLAMRTKWSVMVMCHVPLVR